MNMKKGILSATIIENHKLAENVWQLRFEYKNGSAGENPEVKPGQFVNIYLDRKDLLLPRPISICRAADETLTLVYAVVGKGTEELASYEKGSALRVSTPLGSGFPMENTDIGETALVIGGGLGVPPLLELTCGLIARGVKVDAVLGFREEPFLLAEFEKVGARVHIATENGQNGFRGLVTDLILERKLKADRYFACGPKPMLKALTSLCGAQSKEIAVSLEERMGCGYGACLGCTCKIKDTGGTVNKRVCKDGPVFWGSEVDWDA